MNQISVEELKESELPSWLRLRSAFLGEDKATPSDSEQVKTILNQVEDKNYAIFLAKIDEHAGGFIEISIRDSAAGCRTKGVGYIEAWYVEPIYRREGLGKDLIKAAEKWTLSKGAVEIATHADPIYPIDPVTHKSLGYTEADKPNHFIKILR